MGSLGKIEEALRTLERQQCLFVDTAGNVHTDKMPFLAGQVTPLVSFEAVSPGLFYVYSGIPPRNSTYIRDPRSPTGEREQRSLKYPITVTSGTQLLLGGRRYSFAIPSSSTEDSRGDPNVEAIMRAQPGQVLSLGRGASDTIDKTVSRIHITAKVLEKSADPDGTQKIILKITPGIPGKGRVAIQRTELAEEELWGARLVASGTRVVVGDLGVLSIPFPKGSIEDESLSLSQRIFDGEEIRDLDTYRGCQAREISPFSEGVRCHPRPDGPDEVAVYQANLLQNQIERGLLEIEAGRHHEALNVFRNPTVLTLLGYAFEENHCWFLKEISERAILDNLLRIALDSWFKVEDKTVCPSFGMLREGVTPKNDTERQLLARWRKEIALIYAEEYTHALQDHVGGLVSRKATLIQHLGNEADVTLFFEENRVNLSYEFVKNRYPQRAEALAICRGYQTEEDKVAFTKALQSIPPGGTLTLGGQLVNSSDAQHHFHMERGKATDSAGHARNAILDELAETGVAIVKDVDGSFRLTVPAPNNHCPIFVPDTSGYYQQLNDTAILQPDTPFYLGHGLRFVVR